MAIRNVHIKSLILALARINMETEFIDMGYSEMHGLIIVPAANPPKPIDENSLSPEEPPKNTDVKIDPNASLDDLLG